MKNEAKRNGHGGAWQRLRLLAAMIGLPLAVACDDGFGPQNWSATPDTVIIYSISRPELLGKPSGFDFIQLQPVSVETPGGAGAWDFALGEQNGQFVMLPASAFDGLNSRAAIAPMTESTLEAVREAPSDSAAYRRTAVPIEIGAIYVIRTRRELCSAFGTTGVRYGKMQAIEVDEATGTFRFAAVSNPYCNDRRLIPPGDG